MEVKLLPMLLCASLIWKAHLQDQKEKLQTSKNQLPFFPSNNSRGWKGNLAPPAELQFLVTKNGL